MDDLQEKDPGEVLDYTADWAEDGWLRPADAIVGSVWSSTPPGLTHDSKSHDDQHATVWLSGGTAGALHRVTNTVTTRDGRTGVRSFTLSVRDR